MSMQEIIKAIHINGIFIDGLDLNTFISRKMSEIRDQLKTALKPKGYFPQTKKSV